MQTVGVVGDAGYAQIHNEEKVQRGKVLLIFPQGRERAECGGLSLPGPAPRGRGGEFSWGEGADVEQDVSVGLQPAAMPPLGVGPGGPVWSGMCHSTGSWGLCTFRELPTIC